MRRAACVTLFAVAFAYVEAAVVEYLRGLYLSPEKGGLLFPLMTLDQLQAMGAEHLHRLRIEVGRELATLVIMATVGMATGKTDRERWAYFLLVFGVWDIFYYVWLKVFLDWPESLMTWDLLFLVPVPWVSPVVAPLLVSVVMVVCGLLVVHREAGNRPVHATWSDWIVLLSGGAIVVTAFCWDFRNIMGGGTPNPFNWAVFFVGLSVGIAAFVRAYRRGPHRGAYSGCQE
ncbi:MAG: hypothetical protein AB1646_02510 [Thermodesulfobacteriota bacterium]